MQIELHGALAEEFAHLNHRDWRADSPAQAVRLMNANCPDNDFFRRLKQMNLHVLRETEDGDSYSEHSLNWQTTAKVVHIMPAIEGSGRTAMIIVGTVLVAIAATAMIIGTGGLAAPVLWGAMTAGELALVGGAMVLGGILSPAQSDYEQREDANNRSTLYQGGLNRAAEGAVVPLILGTKVRCGGVIVSTGLSIEQNLYRPPGSV